MSTEAEIEEFLAHYGKKGMQWGVRKRVSGSERREGRKEIRETAKSAGKILRKAQKADSSGERKALAKQYETDVLKRVQSKEFKTAFQNAHTMGKGEMAVHVLMLGPLAALTIPSMKKQYSQQQTIGVETNIAAAKKILKEIQG